MAKVLKIVAIVAGVVALVVPGLQALGVATILGATAGSIAAIAGVVAGVASLGAGLLTKPPPTRGSVTQLAIAVDAPQPYVMGEGYYAGILRYQRSYGAALDKVPNPYRFQAVVYSGGGPVDSLTAYVDLGAIGGYYSGFLYATTALGALPASALVPQWSGAPGWTSASKLSGKAAIGWSFKFDKTGKVFASGMPQTGAYGKWVKVYDPRLDSTFAGGVGSHRLNDESTWAWSENPALHAGVYAYGRHQNGALAGGARRTIGIGLPAEAIDWANLAAWANVCDANGWALFGVVYEPGDRWANLRDICAAGGAEPVLTAAALSFHYNAPRVALDTITEADLLQGAEQGVTAQASWRDRLNTIVAKYRDPAQNWELVQAAPIQISTYLAEDGEVKQAEWPFNFVKSVNQAAQLSRYQLENSRELQGIDLVCGPRLRAYRPGDCLNLDLLAYLGLSGPAVVLRREFDPAALTTKLTLIGETSAKHAYALGQTGTPPATPALGQSGAQRDAVAAGAINPGAVAITLSTDKTVPADYLGAVTAPALAALIWSPRVYQNGATIKLDNGTSYALSNMAGGTFAADNTTGSATKGDVTISALSSNSASVILTVTVDGIAQPGITLKLAKNPAAAPPATTGKSVTWYAGDFTGTSATSFGAVTTVKIVTVASGDALYGTAPLDYAVSGSTTGGRTMTFKWKYRLVGSGGAGTDFPGSPITGSNASSDHYISGELIDGAPGSVAVTQTKPGLAAGDYEVWLEALCSATGRTCTPAGTATVQAKP